MAETTIRSVAARRKYSAEDDPTWARLIVTAPWTLAAITLSAHRDRRVAATIAAGLYENVIVFFDRLSSVDPHNLPALNGELLVDAYSANPDQPVSADPSYVEEALGRLRSRR